MQIKPQKSYTSLTFQGERCQNFHLIEHWVIHGSMNNNNYLYFHQGSISSIVEQRPTFMIAREVQQSTIDKSFIPNRTWTSFSSIFRHHFALSCSIHPLVHCIALQWCHNVCDGVSNHQPHDCLLNRLFRRRSKNTSKLLVTGLCAENSPVTGEFPAQMASNAENVSIWWRHHGPTEFPFTVELINLNPRALDDGRLFHSPDLCRLRLC